MGAGRGVTLEEPGANTGGTHEEGPYLLPSVVWCLRGRGGGMGGVGMVETGHGGGEGETKVQRRTEKGKKARLEWAGDGSNSKWAKEKR